MGRLLAISDIHGNLTRFSGLLDYAKFDYNEDKLVMLGDYVDRGPNAVGTVRAVRFLVEQGMIALQGNHERMLLAFLAGKLSVEEYARNGGNLTIASYMQAFPVEDDMDKALAEDIQFLVTLPYICRHDGFVFAHAGLNPYKKLEDNTQDEILWIREIPSRLQLLSNVERNWWDVPNDDLKSRGEILVFGHTPTVYLGKEPGEIFYGNGYVGIDTGVHFTGWLTLFDVTNCIAYQSGKDNEWRTQQLDPKVVYGR